MYYKYNYNVEVEKAVYDYIKDLDKEDQLKIVFDDITVDDLYEEIRSETDILAGAIYFAEAERCLAGNRDYLVEAIENTGLDDDPKFLKKIIEDPSFADGVIRDYVCDYEMVENFVNDLQNEYYLEYNQEQLDILKEMIANDDYYDFLVNPDLKAEDMSRLYKSIANGDKSMEEVSNETFRILEEPKKEDDLEI